MCIGHSEGISDLNQQKSLSCERTFPPSTIENSKITIIFEELANNLIEDLNETKILGVGKFGWADTKLTTACLGILALNLVAQALILFLSKTFYAAHNTKMTKAALKEEEGIE